MKDLKDKPSCVKLKQLQLASQLQSCRRSAEVAATAPQLTLSVQPRPPSPHAESNFKNPHVLLFLSKPTLQGLQPATSSRPLVKTMTRLTGAGDRGGAIAGMSKVETGLQCVCFPLQERRETHCFLLS